jgi:hypothetical protein
VTIRDLNNFLVRYFKGNKCTIQSNENGVLTVQLNEKMDRLLMNRPFYWHYVKSTGQTGQPMELTLITNPDSNEAKGEWIHFGSPRLQKILTHLKEHERYTKLFEQIQTTERTPLYPWLVVNFQISYQGKQKRDEIISIGLNLMNGVMKTNMMEMLQSYSMHSAIPDYCYTISPLIKLQSGFIRIENVILDYLHRQSKVWAEESLKDLEEEIATLKHFYREDNENEVMLREISEMEERYKPEISMQVINGGIFYLKA